MMRIIMNALSNIHVHGFVSEVLDFLSMRGHLISNFAHLMAYFGTSLGRYTHVEWRGEVYANTNWVLAGKTGCGKGESLAMVEKLFDFDRHDQYLLTVMRKGSFTSGKMLVGYIYDVLHEYDEGESRFLSVDEEFVGVLNALHIPTNKLHAYLINLSDCVDIDETFKKGKVHLSGVHYGSIGHITPALLVKYMSDRLIVGGLANRFLYLYVPKSEYSDQNIAYNEDEGSDFSRIKNQIMKNLSIGSERYRIKLDNEAEDRYRVFARQMYDFSHCSDKVRNLMTRFSKHCLKIALIIAMMNGEEKISLQSMESACAIMEYSRCTLEYLFRDSSASSPTELIKEFIEQRTSVTKTEITLEFANTFTREQKDKALDELLARNAIHASTSTGARGRRTTTYTVNSPVDTAAA